MTVVTPRPWENHGYGLRETTYAKENAVMKKFHLILTGLRTDTRAVTALEYGMIAALIAVVAIAGFTAIGTGLSTTLSTVSSAL
jgi:pilus assembly protein Flp/PilA